MHVPTTVEDRPPALARLGFTVPEVARAVGIHPMTLREKIKLGQIAAVKIGAQFVISVAEIKRLFPHAEV